MVRSGVCGRGLKVAKCGKVAVREEVSKSPL